MNNINIDELQIAGFELLAGSESYMRELSDAELILQAGCGYGSEEEKPPLLVCSISNGQCGYYDYDKGVCYPQ